MLKEECLYILHFFAAIRMLLVIVLTLSKIVAVKLQNIHFIEKGNPSLTLLGN